ncbi:hypothetical protein [Anabaena sp. UHCC 0399]|uniref:hypothetical protein n=1 Tax=Anabaena sp. UHCC 0399 TaxID=3110238 RepID=UPI002B1F2804|nr:hypothetical protein [Anabaena sp. UHCC 0399]MEA5568584.1 hypothetical protein [Anabaena sp. UHCC 0399]
MKHRADNAATGGAVPPWWINFSIGLIPARVSKRTAGWVGAARRRNRLCRLRCIIYCTSTKKPSYYDWAFVGLYSPGYL